MLLYGECDGVVDHAGRWAAVLAAVIFWYKASDVVEFRLPPSLVVGFPGSASQYYKGFLGSGREEFAAQEQQASSMSK